MKRLNQIILIVTFLYFSWLGMQVVHELGHVIGGVVSGGEIERVILHPLKISRTDINPNPHPLFAVWMGPVVGCVIPLIAYLIAILFKVAELYLFRFFAGFCLVANGLYICVASIKQVADADVMMRLGSPQWVLIAFGIVTVPIGFLLWNGLGPAFGQGTAKGEVSPKAALTSAGILVILVLVELLFS